MASDRAIGSKQSAAAGSAHLSLHYFSGTGNTFQVASWVADAAQARGVEVELVPITSRSQGGPPAPTAGRRMLGVLSPTHGFTASWIALRHAATVPGVRGADVFAVVTRAAWYVGPLRLPGLEGTAAWLLALVLALRRGRLVGVEAIDMPSNWTALHWGLSDRHTQVILKAAKAKVSAFAGRLLDGKRQLRGWLSLAVGVLIAPVSLGYLLVARPLLGKYFFADERCTSCGLCVKHCPLGAVHLTGDRKRPYWTYHCESCMRCMNVCPESAIQANWLTAAAHTVVVLVVFEAVAGAVGLAAGLWAQVAAYTALSAIVLALIGPVYWIGWLLSQSWTMAWLLGHATPTRLYRRYRGPGTDLRHI